MEVTKGHDIGPALESAGARLAPGGHLHAAFVVPELDPLAVLETLSESGPRAYLESPSRGRAFAAGAPVATWGGSGEDRFARADAWLAEIAAGLAGVGPAPRICARFPFHPRASDDGLDSRLFLPGWQVLSENGASLVTLVEPAGPGAPARLAARAGQFRRFAYRSGTTAAGEGHPVLSEVGGAWFPSAVRRATGLIREGAFEKIVLTRAFDWRRTAPFDAFRSLHRLRSANPGCHAFLADTPGGVLVGSTPETLLSVSDGVVRTEAVAGTSRRGGTPSEDAALASALLVSDKDNREHRVVIDSIRRRLGLVGVEGAASARPEILRLGQVMHLRTPVIGWLPAGRRFLEVAGELHPTPAVGGKPRDQSLPYIPGFEPHGRGLYTGAVGWVAADGRSGELAVALRCAELAGNRARAYAGAGIVDGSDPAAEAAETEMKLRTVLTCLD
jgi:menaquinone-specific isochorismate synthase